MKPLSPEEASHYLSSLGMKIGSWNRLALLDERAGSSRTYFSYRAPRDANAIYSLSTFATAWLPRGEWRILQFDNSNYFPRVAELFLSRLLGAVQSVDFTQVRTFIFEDTDQELRAQNSGVLTFIIYFLLMFEGHAYIASSRDGDHRLGVQDGFIYFEGGEEAVARGREMVRLFESGAMADWASEVESAWQERKIAGAG